MDIDLQGVHSVKSAAQDLSPRFIFIKPPSFEELRTRLLARSTETDESLAIRLKTAESEMQYADENPGFHDFVVVNDNLEQAYKNLKEAIFEKLTR
jgi:guanylate kinase